MSQKVDTQGPMKAKSGVGLSHLRWDAPRPAQSRVFYSFVTAYRASKLALRLCVPKTLSELMT